jgi:hypothetical protein
VWNNYSLDDAMTGRSRQSRGPSVSTVPGEEPGGPAGTFRAACPQRRSIAPQHGNPRTSRWASASEATLPRRAGPAAWPRHVRGRRLNVLLVSRMATCVSSSSWKSAIDITKAREERKAACRLGPLGRGTRGHSGVNPVHFCHVRRWCNPLLRALITSHEPRSKHQSPTARSTL